MNRDGLLALYAYNAYANHLALDGLAQLSEDEFTRESSPSHSSIRSLLLHLLECEAWFLAICRERTLEEPDLPTLTDIRCYQSDLEREQLEFIGALTGTDLARELTIELRGQPYHL